MSSFIYSAVFIKEVKFHNAGGDGTKQTNRKKQNNVQNEKAEAESLSGGGYHLVFVFFFDIST